MSRPHNFLGFAWIIAWVVLGSVGPAFAQSITLREDESRRYEDWTVIPFGFFSESFGLGLGVGAGYAGAIQEQASLLGTVTVGTRGSYTVAGGLLDLQAPGVDRLFIDTMFCVGHYVNDRVYVDGNPAYPEVRAGANESDPNDFLEETQWDNWAELPLRYVLPLGHGRDTIVSRYQLDHGLLLRGASGGEVWNPLVSGRSYVELTPRWREMTLDYGGPEDLEFSTFNLRAAVEYDNRDYPSNPGRGSFQRIAYTRDGKRLDAAHAWDVLEGEWSCAYSLPPAGWMRQQVLALGVWTAESLSWDTEQQDGAEVITGQPPFFEGATLGGFYHMRGYEASRFHDKAAICYSLEYRVIPAWHPIGELERLRIFEIDWWQWVLFAEAGRVAPEWKASTLHEDMKYDAGISIRAMIAKAIARVDFAVSEEGMRVTAMYGHPF